jgi:pimeloyl-ACP methyl ester carboxylesterase
MFQRQIKIYISLALVFCFLLAGCGKRVPNLDLIFATAKLQKGKRPVIIIPGILGSELQDPNTKEIPWLNLSTIKGDNLALPISPDLLKNRDTLVAKRIIETAKIFSLLPEISVYQSLISSMERYGGYKPGNWENPAPDGDRDTYYVFAYDWRLDNTENARLLTRNVEALKQKLGDADLRFNIIAHSMGGLITRYAAMYGDQDLPANGEKPQPDWAGAAHFNKVFMFGVPNEGAMSTLQIFNEGYTVGGFEIDSIPKDVVLTSPAVFQLLPHQASARFYDENLEPLQIDLYDPETWKKYRWSAYTDVNFRNRFSGQIAAVGKNGRKSEYAEMTLDELDQYFTAVLSRAKAFHDAIDVDTTVPASLGFFAFGGDCDLTLDGAVVYQDAKTNAWKTIFYPKSFRNSEGRKISKDAVRRKILTPGDGRVTRRSLLAETISEENYRNSIFRRTLPVTATFFCETHDELPNNKIMQDNFLTALIQEIMQ